MVEQIAEIGHGRDRRDAGERELRCVAPGELPREERGLAACEKPQVTNWEPASLLHLRAARTESRTACPSLRPIR